MSITFDKLTRAVVAVKRWLTRTPGEIENQPEDERRSVSVDTATEILIAIGLRPTVVSKTNGIFTAKFAYYFDAGKLLDKVNRAFLGASEFKVIKTGNHQHKHIQGAMPGSDQACYVWIRFKHI